MNLCLNVFLALDIYSSESTLEDIKIVSTGLLGTIFNTLAVIVFF